MVTIVSKQKIFDQHTYYEAIMDEPIPHKTFTLEGQGSHEIPEDVSPPTLESYVGTYTKGKTFTK